MCLKRENARLSFELHTPQTGSCFLDNRSLQTSAWDLNWSSGRWRQMFSKALTAALSPSKRIWNSVIKRPICSKRFFPFCLRKAQRRSPRSASPPLRPLFADSTCVLWDKGQSWVYYGAISVSRALLQVKQMERVCVPVSFGPDLHSSAVPHPWRTLLLIAVNRNTERLWSLRGLMACWVLLTLIAFFSFICFLLSNVRGHYYCNNKKGLHLVWLMALGLCWMWIGFFRDDRQP